MIIATALLEHGMATPSPIIVQTEEELLTAIEHQHPVVIIEGNIPLSQAIIVDQYLTLQGQGTLTVSDRHRHFDVRGRDGHLVLDGDITLTRAEYYYDVGGGIEVWRSNFTLKNGHIYNNRAHFGGGLHIIYGSAYLYGGSITHNHANAGGGVKVGESASMFIEHSLTVNGGAIEGNVAEFSGGGIFSFRGNLQLLRGSIRNNQAAGHGGAYIFSSLYRFGSGMRIEGNYPPNRHDSQGLLSFAGLQTLSAVHIIALIAIASVGIVFTKLKSKRTQPQN